MNKQTESPQNEDQNQQETPPPPSASSPSPSPSAPSSGPSSGPSQEPSSSSSVRRSNQEVDEVEAQRQENMRQFNILLTPAFAAFSQISEGLFLTGVGGMSVDNFRRNKITHIINCTHEAPNWRLSGVESCRISIDDVPTQDLSPYLDLAVERIHSILSDGGRVVVHCVAGVSRSAAIVMAYLMKHKKMTLHDAYNHVQSCRRVVRPNNGFFKQLIEYEVKVLGSPSVKMVKLKRDDVTIEIPDFFETEHRKFVLLETFKAKASSLKAIVQSGANPVVQGTQPLPVSGKFHAPKGCKVPHTVPSNKQLTRSPSKSPARSPSKMPSKSPSKLPFKMPFKVPNKSPSNIPTKIKSKIPAQVKSNTSPSSPSTQSKSRVLQASTGSSQTTSNQVQNQSPNQSQNQHHPPPPQPSSSTQQSTQR